MPTRRGGVESASATPWKKRTGGDWDGKYSVVASSWFQQRSEGSFVFSHCRGLSLLGGLCLDPVYDILLPICQEKK